MPLVKVKRFAQVTLPSEVRKQFKIEEGDYLEAEAVTGGILLKPVAVVARNRAWERLLSVSSRVKDLKPANRGEQEEEQLIAQMIKEHRKASRKRKSNAKGRA